MSRVTAGWAIVPSECNPAARQLGGRLCSERTRPLRRAERDVRGVARRAGRALGGTRCDGARARDGTRRSSFRWASQRRRQQRERGRWGRPRTSI